MPAALLGREPRAEGFSLRSALLREASLLQTLRSRGYLAVGLVPFWLYGGAESSFDWQVDHAAAADDLDLAPFHAVAFRQLRLYTATPLAIAEPLLGATFSR